MSPPPRRPKVYHFGLFDRIGVRSQRMADRAETALQGLDPRPAIEIRAQWYY